MRRVSIFRLLLTFFGLTPEYRSIVFTQLHEIVFHGQGGYTWSDVYNMPIWLRRFTFSKLKEHYEKQAEENKKANQQISNKSPKIAKPDIKPSYVSKASTK